MTELDAIKAVIDLLGGPAAAKAAMRVSQPTISCWMNGVHGMSPANAIKAERLVDSQVRASDLCHELRELDTA